MLRLLIFKNSLVLFFFFHLFLKLFFKDFNLEVFLFQTKNEPCAFLHFLCRFFLFFLLLPNSFIIYTLSIIYKLSITTAAKYISPNNNIAVKISSIHIIIIFSHFKFVGLTTELVSRCQANPLDFDRKLQASQKLRLGYSLKK